MAHLLRVFMFTILLALTGSAAARIVMPFPPLLRITDTAAQSVRLVAMKVDSQIVGHLAKTTVELSFRNPNNRILEGELQFPLLDGQQVTAFALDFDGNWRSAVPVEKAKGQAVFEEVTRARIDPALLEVTKGNNFKLRIYPIPAQGSRKVSLTITERLTTAKSGKNAAALYRLPLPVAEKLESFEFRLLATGLAVNQTRVLRGLNGAKWWHSEGEARLGLSRKDYKPEPRVEIALRQPDRALAFSEEKDGSHYFYAEVPGVDMGRATRPAPKQLALVWDASGSGAARDHNREFALLDAWFKAVGNTEVRLSLARDVAEDGGQFSIRNGNWSVLRAVLEKVAYDGATSAAAFKPTASADAVMLFSDGLTNYGATAMPRFDVPLLAVSAAESADTSRLRHAVNQSSGAFVDLMQTPPAAAAKILREMPVQLASLRASGAKELVASARDPVTGRISVAGILTEPEAVVEVEWCTPSGQSRKQNIKIKQGRNAGVFAAQEWARLKLAGLEPEYELNRAEITRLGKIFSLVTRGTSLIVLDRVADYARHEILPPAELRAEYDRLLAQMRVTKEKDSAAHLEQIVKRFNDKVKWWEKDFPKGERPPKKEDHVMPVPSPSVLPSVAMSSTAEMSADRSRVMRKSAPRRAGAPAPSSRSEGSGTTATIQLKKWTPDAPYAERLRKADAKDLYRVYLDERPTYTQSTAFFLDAADIFFDRNQPQLALRILSNLAEMNLENRHILRILGYRLMQVKQAALAIPVLEQVLALAPNEPQSWRDLGLAQAENRQTQQAVNNLYEVVRRPWHNRFPDIELIALAELNAIVATAPEKLNTSAMDARLLRNLPLDLRAVLSWDADNTDIDLWVTDPNGEKAFYANRLTYQGGAMSRDFTGGYGPEEFSLKAAKPGKYLVQAQFYGHRQQVVAGATTLQLKLTTGFGTAQQKDQSVTLRLKGNKEVVTVGEFVVGE
jgi:tetratricopeptide (TPR) repeat protein